MYLSYQCMGKNHQRFVCVCVCWVRGKVTGVQRKVVYVIVLIAELSRTWSWQSCVLDEVVFVFVCVCVWWAGGTGQAVCVTVSVY